MLKARSCGVLLHPTSLPGHDGIGTLGDNARRFVDLLSAMGMSYWQLLPLTPPACGNSPYSSLSAFAGNPLLIDLQQLATEGDLPLEVYGGQFSRRAGGLWRRFRFEARPAPPGCCGLPCCRKELPDRGVLAFLRHDALAA